jgi:uncharacterized protein YecE (DUF72 family)
MPCFIGTSGWQYRHWRNTFYPPDVPAARWLEYFAARFQTVEVNNTFYRLPPATTFRTWAERTPDDFVIAVKMSRYLTHLKRLNDPEEPVSRFLERARELGPKLGPVLLQLPPNLEADHKALARTLGLLTSSVRTAVEFRHDSWFDDTTRQILSDHGAALCIADSLSRRSPVWRTADWTYVRFHEGEDMPHPCYRSEQLEGWARLLREQWGPDATSYAYFNNDGRACALRDAVVLAGFARAEGLSPSRVPDPSDIRVAQE